MAAKFNCALLVVLLLLMPLTAIDNKNWYRTTGSQSEWIEFNN